MKILKVISVATIAALTFACGADNDEGSTSELDGTWVGTCSADGDKFSKETQMFGSGQVTATFSDYSDVSCATETLAIAISNPFSTGAAVTTPAGAKEIMSSPTTKVTVTLKTDELVALYNGTVVGIAATCGGGFVKNKAKEVTAASCGSNLEGVFATTNSYNIYKIDGTKLYFGACGDAGTATDCTSAAKRPTTLDTDFSTKS